MQKRFQQLTGHVSEQNMPRLWCRNTYCQWPRMSVSLQTSPWSWVGEGHFQPLWATGHLPCPHMSQEAETYSSGKGLWGWPYPKSASQDKVSEESLLRLPEGWKCDVRAAVKGLVRWAKAGCKEGMPQSRWGRHSAFSLECSSRNFILTFPNAKDPSRNPFVAHITDLWGQFFSWIWLKNKSTILFKDLGVPWDLVTMIVSFPSEKKGCTFIKLSIVIITYYVRWF